MQYDDIKTQEPVGPMVWALERLGCSVAVVPQANVPRSMTLRMIFPDDEYLEKKCRRLIEEWQTKTG